MTTKKKQKPKMKTTEEMRLKEIEDDKKYPALKRAREEGRRWCS